jgi:hypothetical protein
VARLAAAQAALREAEAARSGEPTVIDATM